jgi:hypothetical protein
LETKFEIVMIKKEGCRPCATFEPIIKKYAVSNGINFRMMFKENMPKDIRPSYYPYFYLRLNDNIIDKWGGTKEEQMKTIINNHLKKSCE